MPVSFGVSGTQRFGDIFGNFGNFQHQASLVVTFETSCVITCRITNVGFYFAFLWKCMNNKLSHKSYTNYHGIGRNLEAFLSAVVFCMK